VPSPEPSVHQPPPSLQLPNVNPPNGPPRCISRRALHRLVALLHGVIHQLNRSSEDIHAVLKAARLGALSVRRRLLTPLKRPAPRLGDVLSRWRRTCLRGGPSPCTRSRVISGPSSSTLTPQLVPALLWAVVLSPVVVRSPPPGTRGPASGMPHSPCSGRRRHVSG
jgi:hypothetical protein